MGWAAMYGDLCEKCGGSVLKGQQIEWDDMEERTVRHVKCPGQAAVCEKCRLVHAGECF